MVLKTDQHYLTPKKFVREIPVTPSSPQQSHPTLRNTGLPHSCGHVEMVTKSNVSQDARRVQLERSAERIVELIRLMEECGIKTRVDLINGAHNF